MTRIAKCRQFDCDVQVEQEPLPFGGRVVWVPQLCPECQAADARIRADYHASLKPQPEAA